MIVTPAEMRSIEEAAFTAGATPESLMDGVGEQVARHISRRAGWGGGAVLVYAGKGNNAGDALAAVRRLNEIRAGHARGQLRFHIRLALDPGDSLGALARKKLDFLPRETFPRLAAGEMIGEAPSLLIIDGLLGIGARGPLREPIRGAAREINALRRTRGAFVIALDTPSGVDAETGQVDPDAVVADETLAVGFAKTGLLADQAANRVGRLRVLELPEFNQARQVAHDAARRGELITAGALSGLLPSRPFDSHKGLYGRIGILAGSVGATGAAVMCAHACARAGAGLITLLVSPDIYPIVAAAATPEVMVKPLHSPLDVLEMDFDVLALGPGLGRAGAEALRGLIERWPKPMVVDADGLNALSEDIAPLTSAAGPRLLTPHPGEMERLREGDARRRSGELTEKTRLSIVRDFTDQYPVTLLLKGARTLIGERGRVPAYNTTGNPGMATGGMGDVLTGICAALVGQKLDLYDAARVAAWLHGWAADAALRRKGWAPVQSQESLLPTDLFAFFGPAFRALRSGPF